MKESLDIMVNRIIMILSSNTPSIYLYGSVVLNDFKSGWSDIDILCLTEKAISHEQSDSLVNLRQILLQEYPVNIYFRSFEGGFLTTNACINNLTDNVVYWGTSGQEITDSYILDPFSKIEIIDSARLLYGNDIRNKMVYPTQNEIRNAIENHYNTIRKYAQETSRRITSACWLLDIARCLYSLKTGKIIAKTAAAEWAIAENIAPNVLILQRAVEVRKNPNYYKTNNDTLDWLALLGPYIQDFANVLEAELYPTN